MTLSLKKRFVCPFGLKMEGSVGFFFFFFPIWTQMICNISHVCAFLGMQTLKNWFDPGVGRYCITLPWLHSKTPHVVTVLWLDSDDVVTILSSTRNLVEGYKTVYLCHLDSYTVTVCNGYLVPSHVVTVQLPTRCLVDRFLHRPHGSGYLITCVSNVVTVQ